MKTIGLLGGMSWESTLAYYREINQIVGERLGGFHSARMLVYSVDFHDIQTLQRAGKWEEAARILAQAAQRLEGAGAQGILLCTNTMHKVAATIEDAVTIPLLHIAEATAAAIMETGARTVGLLGTRVTMEQDFYKGRLEAEYGLRVLVPGAGDRAAVHRIIFEELCKGKTLPASRTVYGRIMRDLAAEGAEGIILGCTEISLLVSPKDAPVPLYDTRALHARRAVDWALASP